MRYKPRVFIGSSTAGLPLAHALAGQIGAGVECHPWSDGSTFELGHAAIEDLEKKAQEVDFAAFILTPDDRRDRGGGLKRVPRDNVLFELGLFMGALGRDRTFGVKPAGLRIDMPTDLSGVTWAEFKSRRDIRSAAKRIKRQIEKLRPRPIRVAGSEELINVYPMRGFVARDTWRAIIKAKRHLWLYGVAECGYAKDPLVGRILQRAADRRCRIRVLLFDPKSRMANTIDKEEGNKPGTLTKRIRQALAQFRRMREACGRVMEIRLYSSRPQAGIVRGDDRALVTNYVRFLAGDNSPTFEVKRTRADGVFEQYVEHFENTWRSARPYR
jgi:hypothetical protein